MQEWIVRVLVDKDAEKAEDTANRMEVEGWRVQSIQDTGDAEEWCWVITACRPRRTPYDGPDPI